MLSPFWQIIGFKNTNDWTEPKKKGVTNDGNLKSIIKVAVPVVVLVVNSEPRADAAASRGSSPPPLGSLTGVAVCQEGADGQEHFRDGEGRAPIVLQDVQADDALAVDVTVIDSGAEGHLEENTQLM